MDPNLDAYRKVTMVLYVFPSDLPDLVQICEALGSTHNRVNDNRLKETSLEKTKWMGSVVEQSCGKNREHLTAANLKVARARIIKCELFVFPHVPSVVIDFAFVHSNGHQPEEVPNLRLDVPDRQSTQAPV